MHLKANKICTFIKKIKLLLELSNETKIIKEFKNETFTKKIEKFKNAFLTTKEMSKVIVARNLKYRRGKRSGWTLKEGIPKFEKKDIVVMSTSGDMAVKPYYSDKFQKINPNVIRLSTLFLTKTLQTKKLKLFQK